jgi:hypothetical protein
MMLLLRALVILGAVLAVISCGNPFAAPSESSDAGALSSAGPESCSTLTLSHSWGNVPAAGGTISKSGTGYCL